MLASFGRGLRAVRRVLANVPTYMILDDHDVTDDWFMNREWCNRVLSQQGDTLGRRVIRNALIAYAVFQAWGNNPDQFAGQQPGAKLLAKLAAGDELGSDLGATSSPPTAADLVGVPDPLAAVAKGASTSALSRPSGSLTWNYRWGPSGWPYELIVLDCRTVRAYLPDPLNPPLLLDDGDGGTRDDQTVRQIPKPDVTPGTPFVTLVVIQTPLLGMLIVDKLASLGQQRAPGLRQRRRGMVDVGPRTASGSGQARGAQPIDCRAVRRRSLLVRDDRRLLGPTAVARRDRAQLPAHRPRRATSVQRGAQRDQKNPVRPRDGVRG